MKTTEPLLTARAIAREVRRRVAGFARRLPRARRADIVRLVRQLLKRSEPVLAGAIRDGQILAWIEATTGQVEPVEQTKVTPAASRIPPLSKLFPEAGDAVRLPAVEHAARYMIDKLDYLPSEFTALSRDAQQTGFTIARAASLDAIESVRKLLAEDVARGGTIKAFRTAVREAIDESALADHQIETLYRTHVARAYSAGQQDVLDTPLVGGEFPYVEYTATHDGRVRPEHLAMEELGLDGTAVYRSDDPTIRKFWPPWAFNCRCLVIPISIEDAAEKGVREAREWLRTGHPPAVPTFVKSPPFDLPKGWVPIRPDLAPVLGA